MVQFKNLKLGDSIFVLNCKTPEILHLKILKYPSFIILGETKCLIITADSILFGVKCIIIRENKINQSIYVPNNDSIIFSDKKLLDYFTDLIYHH